MAFLWLKLFSSVGLICFSCIASPVQYQETEFECVSIYKQSALQHPLMKNHQIQTKPSRELLSMLSTPNDNTIAMKGSEECPEGQVPVHKPKTNLTYNHIHPQKYTRADRLILEQYSQEKSKNSRFFASHHHNQPKTFGELNQHYAIIRTFRNTTKRWRGAQALFSINKPRVMPNQYSKTWILLSYIQGNEMSSIQFGVAVHTKLYPDDRPRLTTLWIGGKQQDGCYNALCPGGYVQVHRSIYPGLVYDKVTVPGGEQQTVHLSVAEDPVTKNWVLTIGTTIIGYWPRETHLAEGASEVYFGGFAGALLPQSVSPPMGTGDFPSKDLTRSSFMKQLKYVLSDYTVVDINSNEVEYYVDAPKCYNVMFLKYVDFVSRETLTFGGPGGQSCM